MSVLKERLQQKIEEHRPRTKKLMKDYCDVVIDEVTVAQAIGGMRGLKSLVTDISYLDAQEGIRYRGYTLPEVFEKLPITISTFPSIPCSPMKPVPLGPNAPKSCATSTNSKALYSEASS